MAGALVGIVPGWLTTLLLGLVPIDFTAPNANARLALATAHAVSETPTLLATLTIASFVLSLDAAVLGGSTTSRRVACRAANLKPAKVLGE